LTLRVTISAKVLSNAHNTPSSLNAASHYIWAYRRRASSEIRRKKKKTEKEKKRKEKKRKKIHLYIFNDKDRRESTPMPN
jgi:hypothetical protein